MELIYPQTSHTNKLMNGIHWEPSLSLSEKEVTDKKRDKLG